MYSTEEKKVKKIIDNLNKITTITPYAVYPLTKKTRKKKTKKKKTRIISDENYKRILHIFFDIDSTLTHKGITSINRNVKSIFEKFKAHNCNLYFCTGRAYQEVKRLTKRYRFGHEYGIAENGGIILGMEDPESGFKRTDKTEPNKVRKHLHDNKIPYQEDSNQKNRKTEIVIDLKSITPGKLNTAIRGSKASVECHQSKKAYHITKNGINKGTAIEVLTSDELEVDSESEKVIGVGDSELDVKMFDYCDEGYLVPGDNKLKNQIRKNKKIRNKVVFLKKTAPHSVAELYELLFPFG